MKGDDEETCLYISNVALKMQLIEKFNESAHACKVLGVLETDPLDPQTATKVLVENGDTEGTDYVNFCDYLANKSGEQKKVDKKVAFKSLLEAMLDIRFRLPPMHNFFGKYFAIDLNSGTVKMILANELFSQNVSSEKMSQADLL